MISLILKILKKISKLKMKLKKNNNHLTPVIIKSLKSTRVIFAGQSY